VTPSGRWHRVAVHQWPSRRHPPVYIFIYLRWTAVTPVEKRTPGFRVRLSSCLTIGRHVLVLGVPSPHFSRIEIEPNRESALCMGLFSHFRDRATGRALRGTSLLLYLSRLSGRLKPPRARLSSPRLAPPVTGDADASIIVPRQNGSPNDLGSPVHRVAALLHDNGIPGRSTRQHRGNENSSFQAGLQTVSVDQGPDPRKGGRPPCCLHAFSC
jgi:hypothetical protein